TTFVLGVVVAPFLISWTVNVACYTALGCSKMGATIVSLGTLSVLAFVGWDQHRTFWAWSKHQMITGEDATRFLGRLLQLYLLPAVAAVVAYLVLSWGSFQLPGIRAGCVGILTLCVLLFFFSKEHAPFMRGTLVQELDEAREKAGPLPPGDPG